MTLLQAAVLGLVQGITEFLPISSTAHLRIIPALLGWSDPGAAYSAVIQLGTVAAVVIYFSKDLGKLFAAWVQGLVQRKPFESLESKLAWFVIVGTLPVGILGLLLKKYIETSLRSLYIIAGSLIVLALLLYLAERIARHRRTVGEMTWLDATVIGLWQAMALVPGSSRSGTTITGGLFLGLRREDAARYSFLLSVPATAAAGLFELRHLLESQVRPPNEMLIVGTVVSFVSGMFAIAGLLRFLRTRTTMVFVGYRIAMGVLLLGLLWGGFLAAGSGAGVKPNLARPAAAATARTE